MKTNSHSNSDLIEKYLFDQMDPNEKKEFETLSKSDATLAEELAIQKSIFESANDEDFKQIYANLKSAEEKYLLEKPKGSVVPIKAVYQLVLVASVAFALFFGWNTFFNNNTSTKLFASYYEPYPMILSFRGESDLISEAVNYYNAQDYERVAETMNQLILMDNLGHIPNMYLGIAHLELGDFKKAIENFELISDSDNPAFRQQAIWYIALTYLKSDEPEKAKSYFENVTENGPEIYRESAKDILKKM